MRITTSGVIPAAVLAASLPLGHHAPAAQEGEPVDLSAPTTLTDAMAECPPGDISAQLLLRRGFLVLRAKILSDHAPGTAETAHAVLSALADQPLLDDHAACSAALAAVRAAVASEPAAAADVLRTLVSRGFAIDRDTLDRRPALRDIAAAARRGLAQLPADDAAVLELEIRRVEHWARGGRMGDAPGPDDLSAVAERYPGTENSVADECVRIREVDERANAAVAYTPDGATPSPGREQRRALATRAWQEQKRESFAEARTHWLEYARAFPTSPFAWIAALRAGECAGRLGDWETAVQDWRAAAAMPSPLPFARVLGHGSAARALEALDRPGEALTELEAAQAAWDSDYGPFVALDVPPPVRKPGPRPRTDARLDVASWFLTGRISELRSLLAEVGGDDVERARWLIGHDRPGEATALLAGFERRHPDSALKPEAAYLRHKGALLAALAAVDADHGADPEGGQAALGALTREPYDFTVTAARIARSFLLLEQGREADAETAMREALGEWHRHQRTREPATALERDVAAIRAEVFRPLGAPVYRGGRWNAFRWPDRLPPYVVVDPEITVNLADGRTTRLRLPQRFPGLDRVLFLDAEQGRLVTAVIERLGGTGTRRPRHVMETPNQPMARARRLVAFLSRFFPARQGHWSGWSLRTSPTVSEIEFLDARGSRARAAVSIGYSGCDVILERTPDGWRAVGRDHDWIT